MKLRATWSVVLVVSGCAVSPPGSAPPPLAGASIAALAEPSVDAAPPLVMPDEPFRRQPPAAGPVKPFNPPSATQFVLRNGIPVYVVRQSSSYCGVRLIAAGGIPDAQASNSNGIEVTNLMVSALFQGTTNCNRATLDATFVSLLTQRPSWLVFQDEIVLSINPPANHLAQAIDVLADMTLRPAYEPKAYERDREQRARSLVEMLLEPGKLVQAVLPHAFYGAHPYGSLATPARMRAVSLAEIVDLHSRVFRSDRLTIVVACDVALDAIQAALEDGFGSTPSRDRTASTPVPTPPPATGSRIAVIDRPGSTIAAIGAGFVGPRSDASDLDAALILLRGAAHQPLGRLPRRLVDQLGLASSADSAKWLHHAGGILGWRARTSTAKVAPLLAEADRTLRAVATDGLTDEEFAVARDSSEFSFALDFETALKTADVYTRWIQRAVPVESLALVPATEASMTVKDVNAAARRYLDVDRMRVVVVGDLSALREPLSALGWGPIEVLDDPAAPERPRGSKRAPN